MREWRMSVAIISVKVVSSAASGIAAGTSVSQAQVRDLVYVYLESLKGKYLWLTCTISVYQKR
jgi:hypothetical protein